MSTTDLVLDVDHFISKFKEEYVGGSEVAVEAASEGGATDSKIKEICEICSSTEVILDEEKRVCKGCGCILGSIFESQGEWRAFSEGRMGADTARCGMAENPLLPSLNSIVIQGNNRYSRLSKWNSISHRDKSFIDVLSYMTEKAKKDSIPMAVVDKASLMFKTISDTSSKRGDIRRSIIAACIYYACQERRVPRSHEHIAELFGVSGKKFTIGCNKCKEILFTKEPKYVGRMREETVEDIIRRVCNVIGLDDAAQKKALEVHQRSEKLGLLINNTPQSAAVSVVYFVCQALKIKKTKKMVADIVGVSQVTVGKTSKNLKDFAEFLLE